MKTQNLSKFVSVFVFICFSFAAISSAQEQLKIGTINMARVMASYHESVSFNKKITQDAQAADIELEQLRDEMRKMVEKREELGKEINSPELTPEKKQSKRMEYQQLTAGLVQFERDLNQQMSTRRNQLMESNRAFRQKTFNKLGAVIEEVSRREGFDLVLERSGVASSGFPLVLYSGKASDFTDLIIKEINKDAPEGFVPDGQGGEVTNP